MAREVIYYDVSPFAALSASAISSEKSSFSELPKLFKENQEFRSLQTCEHNHVILDGTHNEFELNENIALWSTAQSLQNSLFSREIELEIGFGGLQTSSGIAFYFDKENNNYCDLLHVAWYRDGVLLSENDFQPDSSIYSCVNRIEFYNQVKIKFKRMNQPFRFLKIESILFGIVRNFAENSLENLILNEGADLSGKNIYINTAKFTINTKDPIPYLFLKRQPVHVKYNNNILGVYYIDKSKKYADKKFSVEAIDKIGVLDETEEFEGGIFNNIRAEDLIEKIIGGLFDIEISPILCDKTITGWLPIMKKREALAQVAFAIGAIADASRGKLIRFRVLPQSGIKTIGKERVYNTSSVNLEFPYTGIELIEHNFAIGTEIKELFKDKFSGKKKIKFKEPVSGLTITGGTITKIHENYAEISSSGTDDCVLKGKPYIDNKNSIVVKNELQIEGAQERIAKIENFYLINKSISSEIAQRLYKYYSKQNAFNGEFLVNINNNLSQMEQIGDIIKIATVFEDDMTARIEKLSLIPGFKNIKAKGVAREY